MTYRQDFTLPAELPELIRIVINATMQAERSEHLQAGPYQHTEERRGYANGYKPKTMRTRIGDITFAMPQIREGGFHPQAESDHGATVRCEHLLVCGEPGSFAVG